MKRLLVLGILFFEISCTYIKHDELVGKYSLNKTCNVTIDITKVTDDYFYELKGARIKKKGNLEIKYEVREVHLIFGDLSGLLESDSLIILQNYGNSMNQYLNIPECSDKYLEFRKIN